MCTCTWFELESDLIWLKFAYTLCSMTLFSFAKQTAEIMKYPQDSQPKKT